MEGCCKPLSGIWGPGVWEKLVRVKVSVGSSQLLPAASPAQGDEVLLVFHVVLLSFGSLALLPTGKRSDWKPI